MEGSGNLGYMTFFSGSSVGKLDEKNRFVIPQAMRYSLVEEGKLSFFIGLGLGGCLAIYKNSDIKKMIEKFQKKQHVGKYQKFFTLFFSTLHEETCDKIGRTTLPALLKSAVGIKKEIIVAGVLNKIEIWPKEVYDKNLKEMLGLEGEKTDLQKLTEEAFAILGEEEEEESNQPSTDVNLEQILSSIGKKA